MFDGRGAPCSRDYHQRALLGGFSNHRRFDGLAVVSPAAGKKDSTRRADYGNARSTIADDAIRAGANCRGEVRHSVAEDRDAPPVAKSPRVPLGNANDPPSWKAIPNQARRLAGHSGAAVGTQHEKLGDV